jgi:metal-dependent amidase/aminoacylase/carboxypeptidase family protein
VVGSQIVLGLQTITSRQVDFTKSPIVLSIMEIKGGHYKAIADSLSMTVALDWYDRDLRQDVIDRVRRTTENIALGSGADESSILVGVRTLGHLTLDYMLGAQVAK